ncbi:MAG TPA: tetratricopeptide repeat protein [Thermoanaerobaculia bacterium]|jgi:tetratricopeptide (TPR) repeat protein|nr:tetratricopeptide repeat protein [Thermoanaerobaculia bacterium]
MSSQPATLHPAGAAERPALRPGAAGYATRDVAALLGLSVTQVRALIRDGLLSPALGARGEYRFSFQDLILLRTAKALLAANVPRRRIRTALQKLQEQLPAGRPLTGVRITAQDHHVVVRDGQEVWNPESGQILLDFQVADLERQASSLARHSQSLQDKREASAPPVLRQAPETAEAWYAQGCDLEADEDLDAAIAAYRRALEIDPGLADAHLNLGRLRHEMGDLAAAEEHYRAAANARPDEPTTAFNLGVVLQDRGRLAEAAAAYEQALALDGRFADAHYNLAGICEILGRREAAFRHLRTYKTLINR